MADEEIENLPPSDGGGGGGGILPVLLIIILVPALSYVTTSFLLIPKITGEIERVAEEMGKEQKQKAPEQAESVQTYEFEDIVANLSGALHSRYVKVSFTVEGTQIDFIDQVESNKARIIDATLGILSSITLSDLEKPGIRNILRNDLLASFEMALKQELIEQLYFSEFVVQ